LLHPEVARRMNLIANTCALYGIPFRITSTWRSRAAQERLYRAWLARGKTGLPAAPPGTSTHEYGLAFDADFPKEKTSAVVDIAARFGMVWFGPSDRVHFDPFGPALWREIISGR